MKHEHHPPHERDHQLPSVYVNAVYNSGRILVQVRDANGQAVELVKDHEKSMHLVIVRADLETFLHVHPTEMSSGDFQVEVELPAGRYLVFADISPVNGTYAIEPKMVTVGTAPETAKTDWQMLAERDRPAKEIGGKTVTFQHPELTAGEPAILSFDLNGEIPLPYLGAMGHVVVLDEQGKRFIHVHPSAKDRPEFQTEFPSAGFYKLWAEFHFTDTGVLAFPFIVEVAEPDSP
ncbi:hypothetical protein [Planococcus shenhongbingii]|uniref:Secreted protein n=1 Tax=Planococcus shenhongbingii TaxID=3058398 RepID=A0ABT8N7K6_9BACL|nr:hypothetical protein [Planococcus sp. N017]MDN7243868.1 hypothetical protein [Planococcus sp. N017]